MAKDLKQLVSDIAAYITGGGIILYTVWYVGDFPKKLEAHDARIEHLEVTVPKVQEKLDEINQRLSRIEGRLEWLKRNRN